MSGGVSVSHLLVLSAMLHLSGHFITPQQGHFGLYPAVSSA